MDISINYGPKSWIENREDGVVKTIDVKIKGWRNDNNPPQITITRDSVDYTGIDWTKDAEVEETFRIWIPEDSQTNKSFFLAADHTHDHSQGDDGDELYRTACKKWMQQLEADSAFQARVKSVEDQLKSLYQGG